MQVLLTQNVIRGDVARDVGRAGDFGVRVTPLATTYAAPAERYVSSSYVAPATYATPSYLGTSAYVSAPRYSHLPQTVVAPLTSYFSHLPASYSTRVAAPTTTYHSASYPTETRYSDYVPAQTDYYE